jgi:hypothetical protein
MYYKICLVDDIILTKKGIYTFSYLKYHNYLASNQSTPNAKKNLSQKITTDGKNTASTPIKEKNKSTQVSI